MSQDNFTSLKKSPCRVRVEEIEPIHREPSTWRVIVFQALPERADTTVHIYEDTEGMLRKSLKDVLQEVFLQSCQENALL